MTESSIDEKDSVIDRLVAENAGLRCTIEDAQVQIEYAIRDASKLSLRGAIALLVREHITLTEAVKRYERY